MEVMDKWVAEFFLRRQHNPRVSSANLLPALKLGDSVNCLKLKISSVLRDLSNCLVRGTIEEGMLGLLEILENLFQLQGHSVVTESHKSAYCWIAVECTVRFMWPLSASDGLLTDVLERIWTKRIGILKEKGSDLVTDELLKWESDLKKALEDPELYQRIRESNIRYSAISFLSQLLKEQWEILGCSSLESVALRSLLRYKAWNVDSRGDPNPVVDESMRRLESDTISNANERSCEEDRNGSCRESANDVVGVDSFGNHGVDEVNERHVADEEQTMGGAQEQEHEPCLDKRGKTSARKLKDYLLEIQEYISPSTSQGKEPDNGADHSGNVTPQPARVNRTGTGGQDHNESPQQDNANIKSSDGQRTRSGRVRPRLPTPVPLNVSPLKKANSNVRRPVKFWTHEEVDALREGVKEYGKSWKDIKNANPAIFRERTEVDLKDKWRNLFLR